MTGRKGSILLIASLLQIILLLECNFTSWTDDGVYEQTFPGKAPKPPRVDVK